jgi:nucleoside-diphosphate-sugar epimerase
LDWAGYLSTTGVYGDTKGEWVSEAAWLKPTGDRQKRRVEAERGWLGIYRQYGVPMHLFRLAGIYGPGRSALDSVRAGDAKRVDKPGQVFCRVHVDDIAATLRASMAKPTLGAVYNVADDLPTPSHEVVEHACRLLGVEPPPLIPFDQAELSPMAASFYTDCRRVKNDRIKRQLGVTLAYPDYRAGLDAQFAAEQNA